MIDRTDQTLSRLKFKPKQAILPEARRIAGDNHSASRLGDPKRLPNQFLRINPECAYAILDTHDEVKAIRLKIERRCVHFMEVTLLVPCPKSLSQFDTLPRGIYPGDHLGKWREGKHYAAISAAEFEDRLASGQEGPHILYLGQQILLNSRRGKFIYAPKPLSCQLSGIVGHIKSNSSAPQLVKSSPAAIMVNLDYVQPECHIVSY